MTSDDRLEAAALKLFDEALDQPSDAREAWLVAQTDRDPALRARVLALLSFDESGASIETGGAFDHLDAAETQPESIGAYRIIRLLGRGGMGAVWLGERAAGDFDHLVAIKVVRGLARSPRLAERLRYERQTLASLHHPNIAQLYDGGETAAGEPYFIMEYVPGAPLSGALERGLTKQERLAVFRAACEAVAYAHQKLIVHRDLSPANILLTDEGRVKLIDFGISRSFGSAGGGEPQMTMTRGYAAPERIKGEPATTLGDIYSLGVILRDLIAAAPPVRDGDLDAIAAKAAAEAPETRYQSATALIADLDRYAAGRAVEARGAGGLYPVWKFVRRRRFAVGAAALGFLGVAGALAVTSVLYARAEAERREADMRFAQVRELATYMLFDLYDQLEPISGTTKALSGIADKSRDYLDALSKTARSSETLRLEAALGYKRLGDVTGNPIGANLGRRDEAAAHLAHAYKELEALHAGAPGNAQIARGLAETAFSLAVYEFIALDDTEDAIRYASRAEELYAGVIASGAGTDKDEMARIEAKAQSGKPYVWKDEGAMGIDILRAAYAEAEGFLESHPGDAQAKSLASAVGTALAETMMRHFDMTGGGDYAAARPIMDRAIALGRELAAAAEPGETAALRSLYVAFLKRGLISYSMEDDEAALADLNAAESGVRKLLADDPDDLGLKRLLATIVEQKAMALVYLGRQDEAVAVGEGNLETKKGLLATDPGNAARRREVASATMLLGEIHRIAGNGERACALFEDARARYLELDALSPLSDYDRRTGLGAAEEGLAGCGG